MPRERALETREIADARPEVVVHMAAQPLVRRSYDDPLATYEANVMGTANVLDALRGAPDARAAVVVTSDKCYEPRPDGAACREGDPLGGADPYSSSKACAELVTAAYRRSFPGGPAIASARAGNVIGGGDWAEDRLVPDLMRAATEGRAAVVRNPNSIRPWQHVLNPLSGYLMLAQALWDSREHADAWNFGPDEGDARTVRWIIDRLGEAWGEPIAWEQEGGEVSHEARYLKLDSSKARMQLGWSPTWALGDALTSIAAWYRTQGSGGDLRRHALDQIGAFQTGEPPLRAE